MYDVRVLSQYPFFKELMKREERFVFHDSLTGLISRPYMMEYIHSLIRENTPFTLAIIDLDNFKDINDHYGHRTGDDVLTGVAESLREYFGDCGLIGRFGGDEFLAVYTKGNDYDELHEFFDGMFIKNEKLPDPIFRKRLMVKNAMPYITATIGTCSFPDNATNFDWLFSLMDKALYRGKSKGRNCFVIYVPEKHDKLTITSLANHYLYDIFRRIEDIFEMDGDVSEKLVNAVEIIESTLGFSNILWIDPKGEMKDVVKGNVVGTFENISELMENGRYAATDFQHLSKHNPALYECLMRMDMSSILIMQVGKDGRNGYLVVCPEVRTLHIWQDNECATIYMLSMMLDWAFRNKE